MRLRHLNLHGFKTFAPKTDLVFGEGLTAIVGPNGSGKSNVADAVRWVLGEQSLSNLRAKKTEDLIFAGSSNRAPLGMAEVSITIDNTDRLLPLEFSEVTITRRAFRSGENEYYINKSRVRLRDVLEVAAVLGQAYTVVGQGLVDAALSLRPEERRELFEEAAAIRGYFVQREDALRRLLKTEENIARVNDLVAELEPQVRRMERQARHAQEYQKLEVELRDLLRVWYRGRWLQANDALSRAQAAEADALRHVETGKGQVAALSVQLAEVRSQVWNLVDEVSALHEQRAQGQARHAAQSQGHAVLTERLSAITQQRSSVQREQETLEERATTFGAQLTSLEQEAANFGAEIESLEVAGREVARKVAEIDAQLVDTQRGYAKEASALDGLRNHLARLENQLHDTVRQQAERERAASDAQAEIAGLREKLAAEEKSLEERHIALSEAQRGVTRAEREHKEAQQALAESRNRQGDAENARRDAMRRADALASQIAAVAGEQQASLYGGVRAVIEAARHGRLTGYVGAVAELLEVPPDLETAVEAALGGRLQEVVVDTWASAEKAISLLKSSGAGRATFLPMDTLRSSPRPAAPMGPGIIGVAAGLVRYSPELRSVADSLLGRLLIVEDLASARKTLSSIEANSAWTLATLAGEVARPGGSVTGGSNTRADDARARGRTILGRERRRRELLLQQQQLQADLAAKDRELLKALESIREAETGLARCSGQVEERRKQQAAAQLSHVEQQSAVARLQQELSWRTGLLGEARQSVDTLAAAVVQLREEMAAIAEAIGPQQKVVDEWSGRLEELQSKRQEVTQTSGEGDLKRAVLEESLRNVRARQQEWRREIQRVEQRLSELEQRVAQIAREEETFSQSLEQQSGETQRLSAQLAEIEAKIGPSERQVRVLEGDVSRLEGELTSLQALLLESETSHSRAAVECQRCVGTLDSLRIEIWEELAGGATEESSDAGLIEVESSELPSYSRHDGHVDAVPALLDLHGGDAAVEDAQQSVDRERRVFALKSRLSRVGPINPLAMEEHAALSERHDYLQTQLTDLMAAADSLKQVISELDRTMKDQFAATFVQVNEAFQGFFHTLFGGGTARLELTNPDDVSTSGVEIFAQPPGKRMQPLAAMSGGERALTAAALLFALLKVRPVPFCVLDEVDAALDESNVTRFKSALQELGTRTQFVVITHNRGTIEAADTLYGVSMAGDGTSQMLSLRVESGVGVGA